mgnify:CR=1 FL=1
MLLGRNKWMENTMYDDLSVENFMAGLVKRNPGEPEFHQAVQEVADWVIPFIIDNPRYRQAAVIQRMTEPDRILTFRVVWEEDIQEQSHAPAAGCGQGRCGF